MSNSQLRPHQVDQNPLVEALPPATDYLTYLTLVEYNLTIEDLPLLNDLLQDSTLTINIGWDLVFLLTPLLPASEPCLQTIARLGNPREVLLKVTEALRFIEFEMEGTEENADEASSVTASTVNQITEVQASKGIENNTPESSKDRAEKATLPCLKFETLLSMLSILHTRIKTKYPSRFIATTLQGVLAAFSHADVQQERLTEAIHIFVQQILQSHKPKLPPRGRLDESTIEGDITGAVDPEAQLEPSSQEEYEIIKRLMQGFVTHVMEAYMLAISTDEDVPGLAWSSRLFEIMQPDRVVPRRTSLEKRFASEDELKRRQSCVDAMTSLAFETGLRFQDLLRGALEKDQSDSKAEGAEEDPPESIEEIPLSKSGALFFLTSGLVSPVLKRSDKHVPFNVELFPTQLNIAQAFMGTEEAGGLNTTGIEPAALIDAILALGLVALNEGSIGAPECDEQFTQYLQIATLISANSPDPQPRFHAHFLATSVLRAHPSDIYRLSFIRDTLEHCPIENLKASAVSWIKGEVVEANLAGGGISNGEAHISVFTTPICLETLSPFLFPDIRESLGSSNVLENWTVLKMNLSFYLAVLNFYYLLLSAPQLHASLNVAALHMDNNIGGSFISPLQLKSAEFRASLNGGDLADAEGVHGIPGAISDLDILDDVLERVEHGVVELNRTRRSKDGAK